MNRSVPPPRALLVLLFLGGLLAPWIDLLLRTDAARGPGVEGRHAEPWPEWNWSRFRRSNFLPKVELAFNDHLGLRDVLLRWNSRLCLDLWDHSPSATVLVGREGWLYYTGEDSVPIWRGLRPFAEGELARWQGVLERRRDRARALGARYVLVLGPNKESIYPDFLPAGWEPLGPSRLDQLVQWMGTRSDVELVDLRPVLRAARAEDTPEHHLYYEEGTHWHGRGCRAAAREILRRIAASFPAMAKLPESAWRSESSLGAESWRTKMYLGSPAGRLRDEWRQEGPRRAQPLTSEPGAAPTRFEQRVPHAGLPRVVMFHDSFGPGLAKLLTEDFACLVTRQENALDTALVASEHADLVLDLFVERVLAVSDGRCLASPPGRELVHRIDGTDARFDASQDVRLACDASTPADRLRSVGGLGIEARGEPPRPGFVLQGRGSNAALLLPELAPGPARDLVLRLEIQCSTATQADLFFRAEGEAWSEAQSLPLELQRGPNRVEVFLAASEAVRELRLRPGRAALTCLLSRLEVRAVGAR